MRVAIVSDIHGNLTAFQAVLADLRDSAPDLVLHGGDLADGGAGGVEIVDRIRDLGWQGVLGNTDEMLFRPEALTQFAAQLPNLSAMFAAIAEMADFDREILGAERLKWLSALPLTLEHDALALVHASPQSPWRSPQPEAPDADLEAAYSPLGKPVVIYGHVHTPFVRDLANITIANSGSAGLPYDGDTRASYLLLDDGRPRIRRVPYALDRELKALAASGRPHAAWTAKMLETARPQMI